MSYRQWLSVIKLNQPSCSSLRNRRLSCIQTPPLTCAATVCLENCLRGHLKSSHIADKRKNFQMALYPLPPSSNESVIDNGGIVWQAAFLTVQVYFKDRLWWLTKAFTKHLYRSKVPVSNEILVLRHNLLKQCRLSHACRDASLEVQPRSIEKRTRRQCRTVEEEYDFYSFFSFSTCSKADCRCRSTRRQTGASATLCSAFDLAFKSAIDICRSTASACVHLSPWRSGNRTEHFLEIWLCSCKHRRAAHWQSRFFFFFFFTVDRTTKQVQPPSPRYESSFVCPRRAKFWDDP